MADTPASQPRAEQPDRAAATDWVPVDGAAKPVETAYMTSIEHIIEVSHPVRSRIARAMREPHTVAEVADILGVPVTRLYHHVKRLEDIEFIRVVATRKVAAVTERRYQVTAMSHRLDQTVLDPANRPQFAVALGSVFDASKLSLQRQIEDDELSPEELERDTIVSRVRLVLSSERRDELFARLTAIIEEFRDELDEDDPDAHQIELFIAAFPESV